MSPAYRRAPGVRLAALGEDSFAAYSALSGETHILNPESVAVLEALSEHEALAPAQLCARLAPDVDMAPQDLETVLQGAWPALLRAGLVCEVAAGGAG